METQTMITDEQIRALRDEAAAAGDTMQVEICETALGEDDFVSLEDGRHLSTRECRLECQRAIDSASAQDGEE